jgi:hypothetical protein
MNAITVEQNTEKQLLRLAAQRQLYATAKKVLVFHVLLSGPLAVATAFLGLVYPSAKGYVALWGVLVVLCDIFWLTPLQKRLKSSAAGIQEQFDCDVLSLPWNDLKAGKRPDPELVKEQSEKYARWAHTMPSLNDWYPPEVGDLPSHIGRIVCQRSNCWWDAKQRRRYAASIIAIITVVFAVVLILALGNGFTVEDFVLKVLAPVSPALLLGIRQYLEHTDAAARLDKLKEHAEKLWNEALSGKKSQAYLTTAARGLQDEILEGRRRSPLVFDVIFKRLRRDYEIQMNHGAAELVAEARRKMEAK